MKTKFYILMAVSYMLLALTAFSQDDYILWINDNNNDSTFIETLSSYGYKIESYVGDYQGTLSAEKLDSANNAALVVIGRGCSSGGHGGDEALATQWNGITAPILSMSAWLSRNNRWMWFDVDNCGCEATEPWKLTADGVEHAFFDGTVPDGDGFLEIFSPVGYSGDGPNLADAGNGVLLATDSTETLSVMAIWEDYVEFYDGTTQIPENTRIFFAVSTSDCGDSSATNSVYNLNADGLTILLNIVGTYVEAGTGVEESVLNTERISLYPNPASSILQINYLSEYSGEAIASIVDMSGRIVYEYTLGLNQGMNNKYLNVSNITEGTYLLKLNVEDNQYVRKLMIK